MNFPLRKLNMHERKLIPNSIKHVKDAEWALENVSLKFFMLVLKKI